MFGSHKIQDLEYKLRDVTESLDRANREKRELEQKLSESEKKLEQLEAQLSDNDLETLREQTRISQAEFESLKKMYSTKVKEFEDSIEEKEQDFAKEDALKRYNLENEIVDNRKANQAYVADRVKSFGESYMYYLNQIKVLMDALGDIAIHTGAALFTEEYDGRNLMTTIGQEMVGKLKSEADMLRGDENENGVVLIGNVAEEDLSVVEAVASEVEGTATAAAPAAEAATAAGAAATAAEAATTAKV